MFVIKQPAQSHFTKDFGGGTVSHRVITPKRDLCQIKVTEFLPKGGFMPGDPVIHLTEEFVYVLEGRIRISTLGFTSELGAGGSYFVPSGTPTRFEALEDSRLLCVFFPGTDGQLPDED